MKDHVPEWKYVAIVEEKERKKEKEILRLCEFYKVQNVVIFWLF